MNGIDSGTLPLEVQKSIGRNTMTVRASAYAVADRPTPGQKAITSHDCNPHLGHVVAFLFLLLLRRDISIASRQKDIVRSHLQTNPTYPSSPSQTAVVIQAKLKFAHF